MLIARMPSHTRLVRRSARTPRTLRFPDEAGTAPMRTIDTMFNLDKGNYRAELSGQRNPQEVQGPRLVSYGLH
jgi:hypothetical protein